MSEEYIISFDLGTSGVKAVLVGFGGNIKGVSTQNYEILQPCPGWAEQVPSRYWDCCCAAVRELTAQTDLKPSAVKGIIFACQWKGMIPLDRQGNVLHNSIIWMDTRASVQAGRLGSAMGRTFSARDYWPRVMWFRDNHPDLFGRTVKILDACGYLKYRACGSFSGDESSNFCHSNLEKTEKWFSEVLAAAQLDPDLFPGAVAASQCVGYLSRKAAEQMSLEAGTKVYGGLGDIPAVTIGSGAGAPGAAHVYLGTSGWIAQTRTVDEKTPLVPLLLDSERYVEARGLQSACMSFDWCLRNFYGGCSSQNYSLAEKEMAGVPAGCEGLVSVPSLNGEAGPFPSAMRAGFMGLNSGHTRAHMTRAVLEGICQILKVRKNITEKNSGIPIKKVSAVGGGSLSPVWMQILADTLDVEVSVPGGSRYAGALGAAFCAMGKDELPLRFERTYSPHKENAELYEKQSGKFMHACEMLGTLGDS